MGMTVTAAAHDDATQPAFIEPLTLRIGAQRYPITSLEQASLMFCQARDAALHSMAGLRASEVPTPLIFDGTGKQVAYVSRNGRVWPGKPTGPFVPGRKPLCEAQA